MVVKQNPGGRIVELRKTYNISREDLVERSGLALELVRQIEEEGLIPDLAPLVKISRALGVRLGTLLDGHEELGPVVCRAGEAAETGRFITGLSGGDGAAPASVRRGVSFNALAADKGGRHMEPFIVEVGLAAGQDKSAHEGEEFIYVLSGGILLEYGKDSWELSVGDSVYYDSIVPHRVLAAGGAPARILAVIYSPV